MVNLALKIEVFPAIFFCDYDYTFRVNNKHFIVIKVRPTNAAGVNARVLHIYHQTSSEWNGKERGYSVLIGRPFVNSRDYHMTSSVLKGTCHYICKASGEKYLAIVTLLHKIERNAVPAAPDAFKVFVFVTIEDEGSIVDNS